MTQLQAEYGQAVGYEFDWGQIIEEAFDVDLEGDLEDREHRSSLAVRWHFVLRDLYTAFLDRGGNLGELSDLANNILAEFECSRDELPEALREDALPACIAFDEGTTSVHSQSPSLASRTSRLLANG